jgi:alkylation response protein AidB-like acyl-CoA dehydrogenase
MVPADAPGLTVGKIEDKMGHRLCQNSELFFENVRVPKDNLVGKEGEGFTVQESVFHGFGLGVGAIAVGLARAAYEEALKYANERVIWGQLIREHQLVANKLVDMRMKIEASRALVWKLCWAMDNPKLSEGFEKLASMGKVFPTNLIRGITIESMQILGGYGYMRDFPAEKYVRDAMVMPIYDSTNELLTLAIALEL